MQLEYDENQFPNLSRFRQACLAGDVIAMEHAIATSPAWYRNENPTGLSLARLALVFQAQHYASENMIAPLRELVSKHPWVLNHPWTAQRWLPVSQAAWAGHTDALQWLIEHGADTTLLVGGTDEELTVIDMARAGGHEDSVDLLARLAKMDDL